MKRRNLILLLGGAGSGAMSVGTGAFSSMEAERGVEVNVVPDNEAYVRYDNPSSGQSGVSVSNGDLVELVVIKNKISGDAQISIVDVDVDVEPKDGNSPQIENVSFSNNEFGVGESEAITGTIACDGDGGSAEVEVTVRLAGEGLSVELFGDTETRRFEIECDPVSKVSGVDFRGKGNADLLVENDEQGSQSADSDTVEVLIYYLNGSEIHKTELESVSVKHKLRDQTSIDGETIAGVHVAGNEGVYVHPQLDQNECDVTAASNSNGNGVSGGPVRTASDPAVAFDGCFADDK